MAAKYTDINGLLRTKDIQIAKEVANVIHPPSIQQSELGAFNQFAKRVGAHKVGDRYLVSPQQAYSAFYKDKNIAAANFNKAMEQRRARHTGQRIIQPGTIPSIVVSASPKTPESVYNAPNKDLWLIPRGKQDRTANSYFSIRPYLDAVRMEVGGRPSGVLRATLADADIHANMYPSQLNLGTQPPPKSALDAEGIPEQSYQRGYYNTPGIGYHQLAHWLTQPYVTQPRKWSDIFRSRGVGGVYGAQRTHNLYMQKNNAAGSPKYQARTLYMMHYPQATGALLRAKATMTNALGYTPQTIQRGIADMLHKGYVKWDPKRSRVMMTEKLHQNQHFPNTDLQQILTNYKWAQDRVPGQHNLLRAKQIKDYDPDRVVDDMQAIWQQVYNKRNRNTYTV